MGFAAAFPGVKASRFAVGAITRKRGEIRTPGAGLLSSRSAIAKQARLDAQEFDPTRANRDFTFTPSPTETALGGGTGPRQLRSQVRAAEALQSEIDTLNSRLAPLDFPDPNVSGHARGRARRGGRGGPSSQLGGTGGLDEPDIVRRTAVRSQLQSAGGRRGGGSASATLLSGGLEGQTRLGSSI